MVTRAVKSKGIQLQSSNGASPDVFETIAEVKSCDGPSMSLPTDDATSFDSEWAEVIPGVPDGGEISLGMIFVPGAGGQIRLQEDLQNATLRAYRLVYPDASSSKIEFSAYVTAFSRAASNPNAKVEATATLRISGAVS